MTDTINYDDLARQLVQDRVGITAAELHGFLTGVVSGGNNDDGWQPLTQDMLHNGQPLPEPLLTLIKTLYEQTKQQLSDDNFEFQLLLSDRDLFSKIDDLIGWVNHFLLGISLIQPQLANTKGDVGEAIYDLRQIAQLGYDLEDDQDELGFAFEEILEYVRITAILCYEKFSAFDVAPTIH